MFYLSANQKSLTLKFEYVLVQHSRKYGENKSGALK